MAETGSGLESTTTEAVAVYCLGSSKLMASVMMTVESSTASAIQRRALRMERNWPKLMFGIPVKSARLAAVER